ncbi:MAG: hypothetical protein IJK98_04240 [Clostridia bacterium]|nr:hypothetical protein [Clostridia bacterium]
MLTLNIIPYCAVAVFGLVFLVMFLVSRVKQATPKAAAIKAMTSVCFILCWLMLAKQQMNDFAMFIGGGLLFGLLGDIWLDLKFCYPQDDDLFTKLGFSSFAVGHFFYICAVLLGVNGQFQPLALACAAGVAVIAGLVVFFGEKAMKLRYGAYKMISTLYGALLFFMTAFAVFTAVFAGVRENMHLLVMGIGGVFFVISDLILSGTYFGEGKNRPLDIITNHVTYYLAQFIIAASLAFMA